MTDLEINKKFKDLYKDIKEKRQLYYCFKYR